MHVNFHGGGFVMRGTWLDDPLCRYLAAEAGVVVVNVDYVVAPRHPFPAPVRQAYEVVTWLAGHDHGWHGARLTVGGQSAGGVLAARHDVRGADHGYDVGDLRKARETYALITRYVRDATA